LSETISQVEIVNAPWAGTPKLALNSGLVTIIGSRGSGKTALADIIATACDAHGKRPSDQSFIIRANEHLAGAAVTMSWGGGTKVKRPLDLSGEPDWDSYARARYLSQQFVEELCSSDGMTDRLLSEVERVVFDAHGPGEAGGAIDFNDLRDLRAARYRQAREREEEALETLSDRINQELEKKEQLPDFKKHVADKEGRIRDLTADRNRLASKGSEERIKRLSELTEVANNVRSRVRGLNQQEQKLLLVQDEVAGFRSIAAPEALRDAQDRHRESGISGADWDPFLTRYSGDVDAVLARHLDHTRSARTKLAGSPVGDPEADAQPIAADADLATLSLATLEAEIGRLSALVAVDKETKERFVALTTKITAETELLAALKEKVADCEGADARLASLPEQREAAYIKIFEAVLGEQTVLNDIYAPIRAVMDRTGGTLSKLSFSVLRRADVEAWAKAGEELLDLRRTGPFRGEGKLLEKALSDLKPVWETGSANDVAAAMKGFREKYQRDLFQHAPVARSDATAFRAWLKRFARWLYSTEHIEVRYSVEYDGIDIRKLSPGTRGIVLLLLYLALDTADERPLIIDQPEENLDPKSIYDELVELFLAAKAKRQVIMVTHNANLVVNTDADQVIIADAGPQPAQGLPTITYSSGGLEAAHIRKRVCEILEGGEHAFRERARRLRVRLPR
jgi:ABC-type dipeptide/oligopeptide/nickel transport system ATPase component